MSAIKNVIIIGASGNLGPAITNAFLATNKYTVTALTRKESTSTFPSGVKIFRTDYTDSSLKEAFTGQDVVVSVIGAAGLAEQKRIVDAAAAAGVKRFFPSEFGGDVHDPSVVKLIPLFEPKIHTAEYLREVADKTPSFTYTQLATGPFFDWGLKVGFLGPHLPSKTSKIFDSGDVQYSTTTLSKIGEAVVACISPEHNEKTANQAVYVSSFITTPNKVHAAVEKATGDKFTVVPADAKKVWTESKAQYDGGDQSAIMGILTSALFGDEGKGDLSVAKGGLWNDRLGLKEENFEEEIRKAVQGSA